MLPVPEKKAPIRSCRLVIDRLYHAPPDPFPDPTGWLSRTSAPPRPPKPPSRPRYFSNFRLCFAFRFLFAYGRKTEKPGETNMSESFIDSLDSLSFDLELEDPTPLVERAGSRDKLHELAAPVRSLTNSPGCTPGASSTASPIASPIASPMTSPSAPSISPSTSPSTQSVSSAESSPNAGLRPIRRARRVRVDAWAVPASASWSRTRTPMRKVARVSRSTDWALPF